MLCFTSYRSKALKTGPPLSSRPFVQNWDSESVGILAGKKSLQRLAFCFRKKKQKTLLMQKMLAFSIMWFLGRVGRGRLLSISVEHCNLKWLMQNINENVNLWDRGQQIVFPLRSRFLGQTPRNPNQGLSLRRHTSPYPDVKVQVQQEARSRDGLQNGQCAGYSPTPGRASWSYLLHTAHLPFPSRVFPTTASRGTLTPEGAEWQALGLRPHQGGWRCLPSPAWESTWMPHHPRKASCSGHPTLLHGK